jgi:hypothetical protein
LLPISSISFNSTEIFLNKFELVVFVGLCIGEKPQEEIKNSINKNKK